MNALDLKAAEYEAKLKDMEAYLAPFLPDYKMTPEQVEEFRTRTKAIDGVAVDLKQMRDVAASVETTAQQLRLLNTAQRPAGAFAPENGASGPPAPVARKSLGQALIDSPVLQARAKAGGGSFVAEAEIPLAGWGDLRAIAQKTLTPYLIADSTLATPTYLPGFVSLGTQVPMVADLLAQGQMTGASFIYPREDTWTNGATAVAEGDPKPEQTWDVSQVTAYARKVAEIATLSDEMLNDFPVFRSYIDQRMPFAVEQKVDAALLTGAGAPDLVGILNTANVLTQARGTDASQDAILKALVKVMSTGFFLPDGVVLNPINWQTLRLATTSTGVYLFGPPNDAAPNRIWGQPLVLTTAITANTGLVGAFRLGAQLFWREGMRIESSNSTESNFRNNLISIRAEVRLALAVYRPTAFCKVTSLQ